LSLEEMRILQSFSKNARVRSNFLDHPLTQSL